jgi:hypothetical protein
MPKLTEAQRRAVRACFQASSWDWVPLVELLNLLTADGDASTSLGDCIAAGCIEYDEEYDLVRITWNGRVAAGLPACVFPDFSKQSAALTREQRFALLRRTGWFKRGG